MKKKRSSTTMTTDDDDFEARMTMDNDDDDDDESDNDGRPVSVDDKVRKKEMRKGIDLATTLERIEKNFVITDPRLPDNPIVRHTLSPFYSKIKIKLSYFCVTLWFFCV